MTSWARGSLLPLPPIGVGSARVESLASFFVRLAVVHVVPTNVMASTVLPAVLEPVSGRNALFGRRGAWMNGNGRWALALASALEHLTLQPGLDGLTMRPWHRVFPTPRLLSMVRRWCPECYREMRRDYEICWDSLVWALMPVVWCPVHSRRLAEQCPVCARSQPWLPRDTALGWCVWCGADLVCELPSEASPLRPWTGVSLRERWEAEACGELVAIASRGESIVPPRELGRRLLTLLYHLDDGNRSAFARRFGVSLPTPGHWIRTGVIRFDFLLRICWRASVRPTSLLLADIPFDVTS